MHIPDIQSFAPTSPHRAAFTLVELSIVLVIIGLLVGGILVGQELVRQSELRSVPTEHARFMTAIAAFRDKYRALPGDITNATQFWGAANADPATCYATIGTGTQTCDGNGSGIIEGSQATDMHEAYRFWQHLANAGLIAGQYTGVNVTNACWLRMVGGVNSPASKLPGAVWGLREPITLTGYASMFDGTYQNWLQLGGDPGDCDNYVPELNPGEAKSIDEKMDDGKPATGKVVIRTREGTSLTTCTNAGSSTDYNATYLATSTDKTCNLIFPAAF